MSTQQSPLDQNFSRLHITDYMQPEYSPPSSKKPAPLVPPKPHKKLPVMEPVNSYNRTTHNDPVYVNNSVTSGHMRHTPTPPPMPAVSKHQLYRETNTNTDKVSPRHNIYPASYSLVPKSYPAPQIIHSGLLQSGGNSTAPPPPPTTNQSQRNPIYMNTESKTTGSSQPSYHGEQTGYYNRDGGVPTTVHGEGKTTPYNPHQGFGNYSAEVTDSYDKRLPNNPPPNANYSDPSNYSNYSNLTNYSNIANYSDSSNYSNSSNYSDNYTNYNSLTSYGAYTPPPGEEDLPPPPPPEPSIYNPPVNQTFPPPPIEDLTPSPPSPVSSSYSELRRANVEPGYGYGLVSSQSSTYESIYEPIHPRPPSQMSTRSTYGPGSIYSGGYGTTTRAGQGPPGGHKQEAEVDALTNLLVQSMDHSGDPDFFGMCTKCGEKVLGEGRGCTAMEQVYHIDCFTCCTCQLKLQGKPFYAMDGKPYCEEDYLNTLEKCCVCTTPILDRILRATGKPYHPRCFTCVVCSKSLDGIPFTVDATNMIHCIDCFHLKFAPRCVVCKQPIMPESGKQETVRIVAMDKSFHVNCYKCEDCGLILSSEAEGRGCYPLDDHILCKSCNAKRVQALTSRMATEL